MRGSCLYQNKSLSSTKEMDEILRLQGISWVKRTIIAKATITLYIKHYKGDDDGVEHIDIDQVLTGGISTTEPRTLDCETLFAPPVSLRNADKHSGSMRERYDNTFGHVVGRSRRVKLDDVEDAYLKNDWSDDTAEHGAIESYVESDTPKSKTRWIAHQIWGFQEVNGERRYARHVKFTGPKGEDVEALMVYDYRKWFLIVSEGHCSCLRAEESK
jgi:hypothetical protein